MRKTLVPVKSLVRKYAPLNPLPFEGVGVGVGFGVGVGVGLLTVSVASREGVLPELSLTMQRNCVPLSVDEVLLNEYDLDVAPLMLASLRCH